MSESIKITPNRIDFSRRIAEMKNTDPSAVESGNNGLLLGLVGGGVLRLAEVAFDGLDSSEIFAKKYNREPAGKGPHFDVYGKFLHPKHPIIALHNLTGETKLQAAVLPEDLQEIYNSRYPDPEDTTKNQAAYLARRHLSALALEDPSAKISRWTMHPGTSLVLLQLESGPHIIHDIKPVNSENPGSFVKLIAPRDDNAAEAITNAGYEDLDQFVTRTIDSDKDNAPQDDTYEMLNEILEPSEDQPDTDVGASEGYKVLSPRKVSIPSRKSKTRRRVYD